jgi:SHS2 domain-containing protein
MYQSFDHTADLGMLAEAGRALLSILVENPEEVRPETEAAIQIEGTDLEYLLFDWLNELLFRFERDRLLPADFNVTIDAHGLQATVRGEPIDRERHQLAHEIKAVTYHQLEVKETDAGWQARFIVDI